MINKWKIWKRCMKLWKKIAVCGEDYHWFAKENTHKNEEISGEMKNYNSKREDLEEEDQGEDERNVIL